MRKRSIVALGTLSAAALLVTGCSQSNEAPGTQTPTPTPTSTTPVTTIIGDWAVTLTPDGSLPEGWPDVPAPNGGKLVAAGTAESKTEVAGEQVLAAEYQAPGQAAEVAAAQMKQMYAAGWTGGVLEHGFYVYHQGHNEAMIKVNQLGTGPTSDQVVVYQLASKESHSE